MKLSTAETEQNQHGEQEPRRQENRAQARFTKGPQFPGWSISLKVSGLGLDSLGFFRLLNEKRRSSLRQKMAASIDGVLLLKMTSLWTFVTLHVIEKNHCTNTNPGSRITVEGERRSYRRGRKIDGNLHTCSLKDPSPCSTSKRTEEEEMKIRFYIFAERGHAEANDVPNFQLIEPKPRLAFSYA